MPKIAAPPTDPLEQATWLQRVYATQIYDALNDDSLSAAERRQEVNRLGRAMNSAMPHHEIAAVKAELDAKRAKKKRERLRGKTTSVTSGGTRRLRAASPRE